MESDQKRIKDATALQIDFLNNRGGINDLNTPEYNSVTLGRFGYSMGTVSSVANTTYQTVNGEQVNVSIINILYPTGLLYAGENWCY